MTAQEMLRWLEATAMMGSRLGLARVEELLGALGHPERKTRFVHIAGTNGKGSTAAMLASVLAAAGYRTGLYTSPHLLRYNERYRINGAEVCDETLAAVATAVRAAAETMDDAPTQFELLTVIGFELFAREKCDVVVLEVGLGGRLDATNAIPVPACAVITRIGLDHTAILGDTLEKIAREKAGIVKPGGAVVLEDPEPSVHAAVEEICARRGAELHPVDFAAIRRLSDSLGGQHFAWGPFADLFLPLLGAHQLENACTALTAVEVLRSRGFAVSDAAVAEGLSKTVWPGRFECVSEHPALIIDGGHNPQCAGAIAAALREYFPGKKLRFLIGVLADKDFRGIFDALLPLAASVAAVTPDSPRALSAQALCERLRTEYGFDAATPFGTVTQALAAVRRDAGPEDAICVCGSLYMIGEVRALLGLQ